MTLDRITGVYSVKDTQKLQGTGNVTRARACAFPIPGSTKDAVLQCVTLNELAGPEAMPSPEGPREFRQERVEVHLKTLICWSMSCDLLVQGNLISP